MAIKQAAQVLSSGNNAVDSLLSGLRWSGQSLTYSFPGVGSTFLQNYSAEQEPWTNFRTLTASARQGVRQALSLWSSVANITLSEVTDPVSGGVLRFAQSSAPGTAWSYYPNSGESGGDVWFGYRYNFTNPHWQTYSDYAFDTMVHEIGHSLGLKHPHEAIGAFPAANVEIDAMQYSIMSYHSYVGSNTGGYTNGNTSYAQTPMINDIAAIQYMYGANYNSNASNTVYAFSPGDTTIFRTIWDGGGVDTYDVSAYTEGVTLELAPGKWSTLGSNQLAKLGNGFKAPGSVANAYLYQNDTRSYIENAIGGSGDDILRGNAVANYLAGGAGNDQIWGGAGGADVLSDNSGENMFWWTAGDGNDTVISAGKNEALNIYGFAFADRNGSFTADGSMSIGRQNGSDRVILSNWLNQSSTDRIQNFVFNENGVNKAYAWNNGKDVEVNLYSEANRCTQVRYLESVDSSNAILRGSAGDDVIIGGSGRDQIWGGSGGNDWMAGGAGVDTYWWDAGDGQDHIAYAASNADDMVRLYKTDSSCLGVSLQANDLVLSVYGSSLTIHDWNAAKLNYVTFADGSSATLSSYLSIG